MWDGCFGSWPPLVFALLPRRTRHDMLVQVVSCRNARHGPEVNPWTLPRAAKREHLYRPCHFARLTTLEARIWGVWSML